MMDLPEKFLWSIQRISAILLFLFFIWFVISIYSVEINNFQKTVDWINNGYNSVLLFIFSLVVLLHASLGLSVIIDDYVHDKFFKKNIFFLKNLSILICMLFSGICLYLI